MTQTVMTSSMMTLTMMTSTMMAFNYDGIDMNYYTYDDIYTNHVEDEVNKYNIDNYKVGNVPISTIIFFSKKSEHETSLPYPYTFLCNFDLLIFVEIEPINSGTSHTCCPFQPV